MQLANLPDIQLGKSSRPGKALPDPVPSRFQRQLEPHLDLLLIAKLHLQGSWLSSINIHAQKLHIPPVGSLEAQNNPGRTRRDVRPATKYEQTPFPGGQATA